MSTVRSAEQPTNPSTSGVQLSLVSQQQHCIEPDFEEAKRFIEALTTQDGTNDRFTLQTFDDSKRKRSHLARILHGRGNKPALAKLNAEGAGIFSMTNAGDGKGRKEG